MPMLAALHPSITPTHRTSWYTPWRLPPSGLFLIAILHALLLWLALQHPVEKQPISAPVLSVSLLTDDPIPAVQPAPTLIPVPKPRNTPHRSLLQTVTPIATLQTQPANPSPTPHPPETTPPSPVPQTVPTSIPIPTPPRFDADYLDNPAPVYPHLSRRMNEQGRVMLRVRVDASGRPMHIDLHTSSGSPRLDQAAIEAVQRWKFVPARLGDTPIAASVLVPIVFSLH